MLDSAQSMQGYKLHSLDGEIGKAKDFYFDDRYWTIRYLVADAGGWWQDRQVLLSPYALLEVNREGKFISVNLTKKQIEDSPTLETDKPVSRQYEASYQGYYGYPAYWSSNYMWGASPYLVRHEDMWKERERNEKAWDPSLRATREVGRYSIEASDGLLGHVTDFLIDDQTWAIRYLVVDASNGWFGKKVLISPQWIERVSWNDSKVLINLSRDEIKQSPEYTDPSKLTRAYETGLFRHYKRNGYWTSEAADRDEWLAVSPGYRVEGDKENERLRRLYD